MRRRRRSAVHCAHGRLKRPIRGRVCKKKPGGGWHARHRGDKKYHPTGYGPPPPVYTHSMDSSLLGARRRRRRRR